MQLLGNSGHAKARKETRGYSQAMSHSLLSLLTLLVFCNKPAKRQGHSVARAFGAEPSGGGA